MSTNPLCVRRNPNRQAWFRVLLLLLPVLLLPTYPATYCDYRYHYYHYHEYYDYYYYYYYYYYYCYCYNDY